ncbi:hypothetical protein NONO_c00460 [Nocardia nova SH22a]|uniref:Lipopolysaccharide assembly protein A domain-containing protein n=1 Tax=Nocardia nova SH22a TaxID=1415166 RepID=W5TCD8_9NOCA|nr:DUF1049 domain-containing protein [Nocardia nova]AHH14866.1 hypothetical protein NONO_c00460 [Nocardia nova SH22a]
MTAPQKRSILARVSPTQWVALILIVLAIIFVFENRDKVSITVLMIDITSPLWLVLLVLFVVGWIAGVLTVRRRNRR